MISWIGNLFIILGLWYIGDRKRFAFVFSIIGETIWLVYACYIHMWSMAFICGVFAVLAVRNWFKWNQ